MCIVFCTIIILYAVHALYILYVHNVLHILLSPLRTMGPWNVCMYVFMYVCRIYDDDESELVLAMHRIRSLGWKSKLPAISHIL